MLTTVRDDWEAADELTANRCRRARGSVDSPSILAGDPGGDEGAAAGRSHRRRPISPRVTGTKPPPRLAAPPFCSQPAGSIDAYFPHPTPPTASTTEFEFLPPPLFSGNLDFSPVKLLRVSKQGLSHQKSLVRATSTAGCCHHVSAQCVAKGSLRVAAGQQSSLHQQEAREQGKRRA